MIALSLGRAYVAVTGHAPKWYIALELAELARRGRVSSYVDENGERRYVHLG